MKIVKRSGFVVDFDRSRLRRSLLKSGASTHDAEKVLQSISAQIYDGMPTKKIYRLAFEHLKKLPGSTAARYNLRTAIKQLGPAGFFFEKYIAEVLMSEGYKTRTNLILTGKCVTHEIDIVLRKNDVITMAECKFHMRSESRSDVKVPMYILSRFNDLKGQPQQIFAPQDLITECLIVTNNRFTADAITFADCSGLQLLSWDYPKTASLAKKIDENGLYPVTCLTTLTSSEKQKLLILNVLLARELLTGPDTLEQIGLSPGRIRNVGRETAELCNLK